MVIENHKKPVKYVDKVEKGYSRTDLAANRLIELILEKGFQPGDKLPNEYELAALLGIGRSAVREAIRQLVSRNILKVRQGAGTFVAQKTGIPEDPLGLTFIGHDPGLALELSDVRMLIEPVGERGKVRCLGGSGDPPLYRRMLRQQHPAESDVYPLGRLEDCY